MNVYGSAPGHAGDPRVELGPLARAAAGANLVERDRVRRLGAGAIDHDDLAQGGQLIADGLDLGDLRRVLADDHDRFGVPGDPRALLRRVGRVDRHDDRSGRADREAAPRPLDPGRAQHADPLARLDAEVDQPATDLRHDLADLGERDVTPLAVDLVLLRDSIAEQLDRTREQVGDRRWTRS